MIPLKLKLYAAAALLVIGGASFWVHSIKSTAYDAGYSKGSAHVSDSLFVVDSAKMQNLRDSTGRASDSLTLRARIAEAALLAKPLPKIAPKPNVVIDSVAPVPLDSTISVWVESEQRAFPMHVQAARAWAAEDSVLTQVALPIMEKQRAVIVMLDSALTVEKQARAGSDSLAAVYAKRVRELTVRASAVPHHSKWGIAAKAVGAGALVYGVLKSPNAVWWAVHQLTGHR